MIGPGRRALRRALALVIVALPASAFAQGGAPADARGEVWAQENARLGYADPRPGANGDPNAPDAANQDEGKVGDLVPPPLLRTPTDGTAAGWAVRRAELARLVEDEWIGQVPAAAGALRIVWSRHPADAAIPHARAEHWIGQIITPGGAAGPQSGSAPPVIDAIVAMPIGAHGPVPVVIEYGYIWPPGFRIPGPPPPSTRAMALARGWAHIEYRPTLLQADDTAKLGEGLIGLTSFPRQPHDWGALRAWAWGASALRIALARDPRFAAARISLAGHSRFGKAVLVAAAFDHGFADALVSSSGAGGAKLMRRDYGERLENMADPYASVWYAPRLKHYAGAATVADWPVDAHMLIALRAPAPLFISTGLAEQGDGWTDPVGQWIATKLARPAWTATGAPVFAAEPRPAPGSGPTDTPLAFWQHGQGHVMWPAFEEFLDHAERMGRR